MRIVFYSPYLPNHFGGGEKHFFDVALAAAQKHDVCIALPESDFSHLSEIKKKYQLFMGTSLGALTFITTPLAGGSFLQKIAWTAGFDAVYFVTDGSVFFSAARHNYLHIQIPFTNAVSGLVERVKLSSWKHKNTNSEFTKKHIEASWKTPIDLVLYPKVFIPATVSQKREKSILHVGRFFTQLHAKRQDVLIDIFKKLRTVYPEKSSGWKLVLVGQVEDAEYFARLKKQAAGLPVEFISNASHQQVRKLYQTAQFYWHATGFGIDEHTHPEKVEHFGITTAEAMAEGCIPLVHGKGGQLEVLGKLAHDLAWLTQEECVERTAQLLDNKASCLDLQKKVRAQVQQFSEESFLERVTELFNER